MEEHMHSAEIVFPPEINGWEKSEPLIKYNANNLYEYINGGAELYISYDFVQLYTLKYTKENPAYNNQEDIKVDVFDMGTADNAFGVFSHSRESIDHIIDPQVESEYASGLLTFWKDHYYVSILAYPETLDKRETVMALGKSIANSIPKPGQKPAIITLLPQRNLIPESIRYFKHHIWLNSYYYISNQNILFLDKNTDALLAAYQKEGEERTISHLVVLVAYPDETCAEKACKNFLNIYLNNAPQGIQQGKNNHWEACRQIGKHLIILLDADSQDTIHRQLSDLISVLKDS